MRLLPLLLALLLAGCDRRAQLLEEQYAKAVTSGDRCRLADQIADTHLQRNEADQYRRWALTRDIDCNAAQVSD